MDDRERSGPETTWGFIRAAIQAMAGVAYLLEEHPTIGTLLIVTAVATAIYETAAWWRHRGRAADQHHLPEGGAERTGADMGGPVAGRRPAIRRRWQPDRTRTPSRT